MRVTRQHVRYVWRRITAVNRGRIESRRRMYLLFMDESGSTPKPEKARDRYLVIGSVIIPEGAWQAVARHFQAIKRELKIREEVKWKYFGRHSVERGNPLSHLTDEEREKLRLDLFSLITSRRAIKIICCVTSIEAAYERPTIDDQDDIYHLTYKGVTERFQYFLQDASKEIGQPQYGMVISDHRMASDDRKLRIRHHQLIESKEDFTSNYKNVVETIFFSPSEASVGLQLADMVAGAVSRAYEANDRRFSKLIRGSFRTSPTGDIQGYGLVKMPLSNFREPSGGEAEASPTR